MRRDQYWLKPKKARSAKPDHSAWWYANAKGIEVHVDTNHNSMHGTVHIPRAKLLEYIKRSSK